MIGIFLIKKPHKTGMPNLVTGVTCTDHASVQPELFNKRYFPTASKTIHPSDGYYGPGVDTAMVTCGCDFQYGVME